MKLKLLVAFLSFFYCSFIYAQQPIIIKDSLKNANVCEYASVFQDKDGNMPFEKIKQQHFQPNKGNSFHFSFSPNVFWFRFQTDNQSKLNLNHWYFLWSERRNDHVDLYIPLPDGKYQILKGGMLTKASERAYNDLVPTYKMGVLPVNGLQTYYIRVKSSWPINSQFSLVSQDELIDLLPIIYMNIWIVVGIHLLRVLYNIILAWYIRNIPFRWYTFHTLVVLTANLGSYGIISLLFSNSPILGGYLNDVFFQLMPASFTLFFYSILKVKSNYPRLKVVFYFIIACSVIQVPLFLVVPKMYLLMLHNYLLAFTVVFLIGISIYTLIKRIPIDTYLLIPSFFMLPPFFFLSLQMLGYIKGDWLYLLMYPTTLLEILSLALVIGKVIEISNQEKNLTEQKLFAEKIETEKLQELDSLKTQFFTNISHEFRTPLTLILSPIDDLIQKYPKETLFYGMKRNAQRLLTLINQLLDLSKLDVGQMNIEIQRSDLAKFIQVLGSSFSSVAESRNIDFRITQNRKEAIAYFDADKIEKIIINLLSNAFKFTKDGGKIGIEVNYDDNFNEVEIIIKDNGIGISGQKIGKIFDRFYQIDGSHQRNYEGSGIGLALVKEMVSLHKGHISVESTEDEGSTFFVKLPINKATWETESLVLYPSKMVSMLDLPTKTQAPVIESITGAITENILLIVEDNPDLRAYIRSVFEHEYQIIEAIDGQEGIEKAMETIPDIVVCDLMMPRLDGFGFCKILKTDEKTNHIPVIMLTAKANVESRIEGFDLGADDYLTKPFNKEELLARVKNLVAQRILLRQKYDKQIVDLKPSEVRVSSTDEKFIHKVKAIIESHLSESSFDVEQLAKEMDMTAVVLRRKLKAITGQTVTEFVRKYRIQKAANLLSNQSGSVSEIAFQVGFESLSYFTKVFQEEFGKLPSEYH